jgi:hypothetical protein
MSKKTPPDGDVRLLRSAMFCVAHQHETPVRRLQDAQR